MTIEEKIEEIAKEVGNNCVDFYANDVDFVCIEDGLRQIANEQKKIDEEENGKALLYAVHKTAERTKKEMIDKACEWLIQHWKMEGAYVNAQGELCYRCIDNFRKALED